MNKNIKIDQFLCVQTYCNQERILINYGKLIPGGGGGQLSSAKITKTIKIHSRMCSYIIIRISIKIQYIVYARKKIDISMKCLHSNSFIQLNSSSESLVKAYKNLAKKPIFIHQKAMFIINYIYHKAIVKNWQLQLVESFVSYRVIDLVKIYVYYEFMKLYFLELHLKTFIRIFYTVIVLYLPEIYLFVY